MRTTSTTGIGTEMVIDVPNGDDPIATELIANQIIRDLTTLLEGFTKVVKDNEKATPLSANHLEQLIVSLSGMVLDWLEAWPS